MASEYNCITRKIEVHLHRHGDSDKDNQRYKDEYHIWDTINDNLYKAANCIASHCFFNDTYEYRLRIHSPQLEKVQAELRQATKNKLSEAEIKRLKAERKAIFDEIKQQRKIFLHGGQAKDSNPEQNSTYKVVRHDFGDIIPSDILTCLNQNIVSTYNTYRKEIEFGTRSIPNFKKGIPVPFSIKSNNKLRLRKRDDGTIYILFPRELEWDLTFNRDRSNNREIVERILSGLYDTTSVSSIQESKNGKIFLYLVVKIPQQKTALDFNRIVGVDLGINTPLCAALNDDENHYNGFSIGSRESFLKVRMKLFAQKREMQRALRSSTNGGRGRKHKLQALERLNEKERNWVRLQNHIFSKNLIEFAKKNNAGIIHMEKLTGFGRNKFNEIEEEGYKFILRYWSFFELQQDIEYKAKLAGIRIRYVNPYHTSQICSYCGHYETGQRVSQAKFVCKNPKCEKGKGKKLNDGSYEGINADWNAARNIAMSNEIIEEFN